MRLFTAIDIPDEVRTALRALLARLRPLADLRWSAVENLHITTKFIGEWPEARLGEIHAALRRVVAGPIDIAIRGLGWLPNPHRPRVLFAHVEASRELAALALVTEKALAEIGVPEEKREFRPHLTLARVKDRVPQLALPSFESGSFRATVQCLYLSAGGKYTRLGSFVIT